MDSKYEAVYNNRANVYYVTKQYQKALDDFSKAFHLDPKDGKIYVGRAKVYEAMGKHDLAKRELAKAEKLGIKTD